MSDNMKRIPVRPVTIGMKSLRNGSRGNSALLNSDDIELPNSAVDIRKDKANKSMKGVPNNPGVSVGRMDDKKTKIARRNQRTAAQFNTNSYDTSSRSWWGQWGASARRSSYENAGISSGAFGDIPLYFVMMNENNGGIMYWPVTLKEKYSWYRYFYRHEAYVGQAIDLHTDLPLSKLSLNMPEVPKNKGESEKERQKRADGIKARYENLIGHIKLFEKLQQILHEYNLIGDVWVFHEWNEKDGIWDELVILPPEEVNIFPYPFSQFSRVEYYPERLLALLDTVNQFGEDSLNDDEIDILKYVPEEILDMIMEKGMVVMDTDPSTGSYVYQLSRKRSPYADLGVSILERILVALLQKEHYRYTQLGLASRNMTPKNKIQAPGLAPNELEDLREQVDLSYLDPDYSIVTNYDWDWQQIGADARLLDLQREYETIENQLFAGLGVTRELLTGEGSYAGSKITVEILNTRYLLTREILQNYVEEYLFKPVAEHHKDYYIDEFGYKHYLFPQLGFNRLSIRDNQEVFDSLFQLYQKGSLPIEIIYELFNLNTQELHKKIEDNLFTVKDSQFNEVVREVYTAATEQIAQGDTNIAKKIAKSLGITYKAPATEPEGGGDEFGGGFDDENSGGFDDEENTKEDVAEENTYKETENTENVVESK